MSSTHSISLPEASSASGVASRFDRALARILVHAAEVFYENGYEGASMRDLSGASGISLAGLYHYCESKEELLYLIQKHTFTTIVQRLRQRLDYVSDPELGIRIFIHNHIDYFLANRKAMTVLSHEDDTLSGDFSSEIAAIKKEYYLICIGLLDDLKRTKRLEFNSRIAVLSLFGMVNWIYTWYNSRVDAGSDQLANEMADIFLRGIGAPRVKKIRKRKITSLR